jgi:transcriptional regulator
MDIEYSIGMPNREQTKTDVLQGTLDLMVLQTLDTMGPLHGYAIAARLEQVSSGAVRLNMGTLYPGLMRLEQRGFVRGEWGVTENSRKARFYAITAAGRRHLAKQKEGWDRTVSIMQAVLRDQS